MNGCVKVLIAAALASIPCLAADAVAFSVHATADIAPDANPGSRFWKGIPSVIADRDQFDKPVPGHRTEIRSRWTAHYLYLLFVCLYQQLYLRPNPDTKNETNGLWNWDVAEAFLGNDFHNIRRYREFEVSPRGEWVDLDIDLSNPHKEDGWKWNSGFQVATRIDQSRHIWYAVMRIPWTAFGVATPKSGDELRANFYRAQGPPPARKEICWQPTKTPTFHTPEAFGKLRLIER
jgi:hypothetical protein